MSDAQPRIPTNRTTLPDGEVHLWSARLDGMERCGGNLERILSRGEKARADRFRFERDRVHYATGQGILRSLLGSYLDVEPGAVVFDRERNGKPMLSSRSGQGPIRFSMSRSGGLALYAFSRDKELGVDVERIDPIPEMDRIVERFFSPREIRDYYRIPVNGRAEAFFRCWTRKEAFLKATGEGLFRPLDTFSVSIRSDESPRIVENRMQPEATDAWSVRELSSEEGYLAALVVQGPQFRLRCMQWPHSSGT